MDSLTVLKIAVRRWWITLPLLVLTAVAAWSIGVREEVRYHMEGSYALNAFLPTPDADDVPITLEPVLGAEVIIQLVQADSTKTDLGVVPDDTYTIRSEQDDAGTVFIVAAEGGDPWVVVGIADRVLDRIGQQIDQLQEGADVPVERRLTTRRLATPLAADPQYSALALEQAELSGEAPKPTSYIAIGSTLLPTIPAVPEAPIRPNPFPPHEETVRLLLERLTAPEIMSDLSPRDTTVVEFSTLPGDRSRVFYTSVTADRSEWAQQAFDRAQDIASRELQQMQDRADVAGEGRTTVLTLAAPEQPEARQGDTRRAMLTTIALGLIAAMSIAVLVDGYLQGRTVRPAHGFDGEVQITSEPQLPLNGKHPDDRPDDRVNERVGP